MGKKKRGETTRFISRVGVDEEKEFNIYEVRGAKGLTAPESWPERIIMAPSLSLCSSDALGFWLVRSLGAAAAIKKMDVRE